MAEYFSTKEDAEQFIKEWYAKDGRSPVFFAKILNHGVEKWIVNYDPRQEPRASPYIKLLENHSHEIQQIVTAPQQQQSSQSQDESSRSTPLGSKYNVLVGEKATALAVEGDVFRAGEGVAAFITFVGSPPALSLAGDCLLLSGRLRCPCGDEFTFDEKFYGAFSGGETRCPSCDRGFSDGFHYETSGYQSGFFLYFCSNRREPISITIDDVRLVDEAEARRLAEERKRRQEEEAKQREKQQREQEERHKREQERIALLKQRREAEGKCIMCGKSLGLFDKIFRRRQHSNCTKFRE